MKTTPIKTDHIKADHIKMSSKITTSQKLLKKRQPNS